MLSDLLFGRAEGRIGDQSAALNNRSREALYHAMSAPVELETLPPSQSQSEQPSTAPSIAPSQDEEQQQLRPPTVPNSGRPACFRSLAHEVIFVFVVSSAQMMTVLSHAIK